MNQNPYLHDSIFVLQEVHIVYLIYSLNLSDLYIYPSFFLTGRLPSSPSVFTSDEYRAWLSRAPSTSALYETLRPRLPTHYSAENIHDALKNVRHNVITCYEVKLFYNIH